MTELTIDIIKQLLKEQTAELKIEMGESLKEAKAQLGESEEKIGRLESRSLYFERKEEKNNHQARIKGTEIVIDGKWYTPKELQERELNTEIEGNEESSD
ncbi:hypothetical protein JTB14_005133 [Gonioctena quinquepunctata]|nr:hypothetical protein JTB14_005133 [Gonioctena quinquepunctata]